VKKLSGYGTLHSTAEQALRSSVRDSPLNASLNSVAGAVP